MFAQGKNGQILLVKGHKDVTKQTLARKSKNDLIIKLNWLNESLGSDGFIPLLSNLTGIFPMKEYLQNNITEHNNGHFQSKTHTWQKQEEEMRKKNKFG